MKTSSAPAAAVGACSVLLALQLAGSTTAYAADAAADTNAADASTAAASKTSFAAFAVLLLGAIASAIGGSLAVQRRLQVT